MLTQACIQDETYSSAQRPDLLMLPYMLVHGDVQAVREGKPFYWGIAGSLVLVGYGFLPTAQPTSNFGRIYAGAPEPHTALTTLGSQVTSACCK